MLTTAGNLATALSAQGKHAEAVEIEREVLVQRTHLLGTEYERALMSASNLAASLSRCGQKTEAEQLLRQTLTLARCTLGPIHERTQRVLLQMRALGLAAR